jgi:hypothetical protein
MAKNGAKGNGRKGSVRDRTQFEHNGIWYKRDAETGQIMDGKADGAPFKGVAKELDGRRNNAN